MKPGPPARLLGGTIADTNEPWREVSQSREMLLVGCTQTGLMRFNDDCDLYVVIPSCSQVYHYFWSDKFVNIYPSNAIFFKLTQQFYWVTRYLYIISF